MKKKKIYWCKHACKSYKISTSRRITYAKKAWDPNSSILVSSTLLFKRDQEFESLLRNREKRDLKLIQISMQIRNKKGRTISFQWCMEISTQRLLKHSTAYLIHQHKSEWIPVLKRHQLHIQSTVFKLSTKEAVQNMYKSF